jgi:hypothetical protein
MTVTFADLKNALARDIRDPNLVTFKDQMLGDLINMGIDEVGRVYPREVLLDIAPVALTYDYTCALMQAFRVELIRNGRWNGWLAPNEDDSTQGGWELFAGQLHLAEGVVDSLDSVTDVIRVWGYAPRARLVDDADIAELDDKAEFGVRAFGRWMAYQSLLAERALFKQWQATSQNSDISQTQLMGLVTLYSGQWDRERNHLKTLRRV